MKIYEFYEIFKPLVKCDHTIGIYVVLRGHCDKCGREITKRDYE